MPALGSPIKPGVGDDLQLHRDPALLAGMALLDLARSPVGGRFEVGVAVPPFAAACHDHLIAGLFEVAQQVASIAIAHQGAGEGPR